MTSISIGYMAEFYVDWGFQGMLFAVFCFGCWIGVASAAVRRLSGPAIFVNAVMIMVFLRVSEFETQFVKSLAAMNMSLVVNLVMLALARPFVTRVIDLRPISDTRIDAPVRVAAPVSPAPSL